MKIYLGNKGDTELELADDDTIYVSPLAKCTGGVTHCEAKQAFRVELWDAFTKTQQYIYYKSKTRFDTCLRYDTYDEAKVAAEEYYRTHNQVWKDTIIPIKAKDIHETIMKDYRYVQPTMEYDEQAVPIDPYFLGIWLGDSKSTNMANNDKKTDVQVMAYMEKLAKEHKIAFTQATYDTMKKLDLIANKHIPTTYVHNSKKVRLEVIAGLIDSNGHLNNNTYDIMQKSETIAEEILALAMSVGIYAEQKSKTTSKGYSYHRMMLHIPDMERAPPVRNKDKKWSTPGIEYGIRMSKKQKDECRTHWTHKMKVDLIVMASNYIDAHGRIPWKTIVENEPDYASFNPDTLRGHYKTFSKELEQASS